MAQPICVMYVPREFSFTAGGRIVEPLDLMKEFNGWGSEGRFEPRAPLGDYRWFCFFKDGITEPELKTFYDKDFTPLQYEELKELITKEWAASNGS